MNGCKFQFDAMKSKDMHKGSPSSHSLRFAILFFLLLMANSKSLALTNESFTINSGGGRIEGGVYECTSSLGGSMIPQAMESDRHVLKIGYINQFLHFPELDLDDNGIPDEDDPDDDGDGLKDTEELAGNRFDPATATDPQNPDTDGDGMSDGAEAEAGTDPLNPSAYLAFTSVMEKNNEIILTWRARASYSYLLYSDQTLNGLSSSSPAWTNSVNVSTEGTGDWQVVEGVWTNTAATETEYFRIEPQQKGGL